MIFDSPPVYRFDRLQSINIKKIQSCQNEKIILKQNHKRNQSTMRQPYHPLPLTRSPSTIYHQMHPNNQISMHRRPLHPMPMHQNKPMQHHHQTDPHQPFPPHLPLQMQSGKKTPISISVLVSLLHGNKTIPTARLN